MIKIEVVKTDAQERLESGVEWVDCNINENFIESMYAKSYFRYIGKYDSDGNEIEPPTYETQWYIHTTTTLYHVSEKSYNKVKKELSKKESKALNS